MPSSPTLRTSAYAGLVKYPSGKQGIVFAGGNEESNTDVLMLDTLLWQPGPDFVSRFVVGASVPFGDSFLAVGGAKGSTPSNTIYYFDPVRETFILLVETLSTPRQNLAAFLISDALADCK